MFKYWFVFQLLFLCHWWISVGFSLVISDGYQCFSKKLSKVNSKFSILRLHEAKEKSVENGIDLLSLSNPSLESQYLRRSVQHWLNEEYIPLEVHSTIGTVVANCYLQYRNEGVEDLGTFVLRLGTDLEQKVNFYDAFVNAWDVANHCSDLLLLIMNREMCQCTGNLENAQKLAIDMGLLVDKKVNPYHVVYSSLGTFTKNDYTRLCGQLSSQFNRYTYMQSLLQEPDVDWIVLNRVVAIMMGYQYKGEILLQNNTIAPPKWVNLVNPVDFSDLNKHELNDHLRSEMPVSHSDMDITLQPLLGYESYQDLLLSKNPATIRKLLIAKWLYLKGFLTESFPPIKRFVLPEDPSDSYEDDTELENPSKKLFYTK